MTDGQKALISDICLELTEHWSEFSEPVSQTSIQHRYHHRIKQHYGPQATVTWLYHVLSGAEVIKTIRKKTGGAWALPIEVWRGLDAEGQQALKALVQGLEDPRSTLRRASIEKRRLQASGD